MNRCSVRLRLPRGASRHSIAPRSLPTLAFTLAACCLCRCSVNRASPAARRRGAAPLLPHGTINLSLKGVRPPRAGTLRGPRRQDTGAALATTPGWCTGLDLVDFPTIAGFETDYPVSTMRQASRRSWRIGLSRPVKVVLMAYRNKPPGRRPQAGGQETPAVPSSGRWKSSTSPAGSARSPLARGPYRSGLDT